MLHVGTVVSTDDVGLLGDDFIKMQEASCSS